MAKSLKTLKKQYDEVIEITSYMFLIVVKQGKYGVIDRYSGDFIIPLDYENIQEAERGFLVEKNGLYGILDSDNYTLIPVEYDEIIDGLWSGILKKDGKYAIYQFNNDGNSQLYLSMTAFKYDKVTTFDMRSKIFIVSCDGKCGVVYELEEVIPQHYDFISDFQWFEPNQYIAIASLNNQYGIIDLKHQIILPFDYEELNFTEMEHLFLAKKDGLYGLFNYTKNKMKTLTPFKYHEILDFHDDLAGFCIQSKSFKIFTKQQWGFMDIHGVEIITPQFDAIIYPFIHGRAYVELKGERFFIDKTGQRVQEDIPTEYANKVRILTDNINQLADYLRHANEQYYQMKKHDLTLWYWSAPYDFNIDGVSEYHPYQEEFKLYNQLRQKMRLEQVDNLDEILQNEQHYPVISVSFNARTLLGNKEYDAIIFFAMICENQRVYLTHNITLLGSYLDMLKQSKPFDFDALTTEENRLFDVLMTHVETLCHDLEISTEYNQGIFNHQTFDIEDDIKYFLELLNFAKQFNQREINKIQKDYLELVNGSDKMRKKLEKSLYLERGDLENVSQEYLIYLFFNERLNGYVDDWKFDIEQLSEYITCEIQHPFLLNNDDYFQGMEHINRKLEQESEYSLLNLNSGGDDIYFILIKTVDKAEILNVAQRLNIPLHDI